MVAICLRMPEKLHRKLKEAAGTRGMSLNGYILSLLWESKG